MTNYDKIKAKQKRELKNLDTEIHIPELTVICISNTLIIILRDGLVGGSESVGMPPTLVEVVIRMRSKLYYDRFYFLLHFLLQL